MLELLRKYSQDEVNVEVSAASIFGFTDDGIVIAPVGDSAFALEGANGGIAVAIRATRLYTVTFNMMETSQDNAALAQRFGQFSEFYLRDNFGDDLARGIIWGQTEPEMGKGKELGSRVWVFGAQLQVAHGGNEVALQLAQ